MKMNSSHEMSCMSCIKHTLDNVQIRYMPHTGVQKPYESNWCMRIKE